MAIYGYARVSTVGQTLEVQKAQLAAAGATKVFAEKASAKEAAKRPELERLLDRLEAGDVLVVSKLDRLARSTRDLLNIVHRIDNAGAKFRSLQDAAFDTTTPTGKLMLHVLAGIAEFERALILERTNEGRARAKAEGKEFGRKPKLTAHQQREIVKRLAAGETTRDLGASYRVDQSTIVRINARRVGSLAAA